MKARDAKYADTVNIYSKRLNYAASKEKPLFTGSNMYKRAASQRQITHLQREGIDTAIDNKLTANQRVRPNIALSQKIKEK